MQDNISDPISTIAKQEGGQKKASRDLSGRLGNMPVEGVQGFGIIKHHHRHYRRAAKELERIHCHASSFAIMRSTSQTRLE